MKHIDVAQKLVEIRETRFGKWSVHAPGMKGMSRLQETFDSREKAEQHAAAIVGHLAAILQAALVVRMNHHRGKTNRQGIMELCEAACSGHLSAGELQDQLEAQQFGSWLDGRKSIIEEKNFG